MWSQTEIGEKRADTASVCREDRYGTVRDAAIMTGLPNQERSQAVVSFRVHKERRMRCGGCAISLQHSRRSSLNRIHIRVKQQRSKAAYSLLVPTVVYSPDHPSTAFIFDEPLNTWKESLSYLTQLLSLSVCLCFPMRWGYFLAYRCAGPEHCHCRLITHWLRLRSGVFSQPRPLLMSLTCFKCYESYPNDIPTLS